jgi:uncharacterized protein (DUF2235 family)
MASTTLQKGGKLSNSKALNLALGKSFDSHVLGGYRFLMRHYRAGTIIYIFGFSRGAYVARFLNEMLDHAGLLGPDNEEVLPFIWNAFAAWKLAKNDDTEEKDRAVHILKECRATLSRPMPHVHFLGMFDAVNSVADFEVNIDDMPTSRIVRHAVSIDERRIKFRPVLLRSKRADWFVNPPPLQATDQARFGAYDTAKESETPRDDKEKPTREYETTAGPSDIPVSATGSASSNDHDHDSESNDKDDHQQQDAKEVWFPGGHADIGGGWDRAPDEEQQLSHAPLVWMVQEALCAGLRLKLQEVKQQGCIENVCSEGSGSSSSAFSPSHSDFVHALRLGATQGRLHDRLRFGNGLPVTSVLSWRLIEYLPLRRWNLECNGNWRAVRWPPSRGEARDIPLSAGIHTSAIQRMKSDPTYRPDNLTLDWLKRRILPASSTRRGSWVNWVVHEHEGDPVPETYIRDCAKLPRMRPN